MSPKQAGAKLTQIASRVAKTSERELFAAQERGLNVAVQQSSGSHSLEQLKEIARRRGSGVYSRRNPDARFDPSKINAQSGRFRAAWSKGTPYRDSAGVLHAPVVNASQEASYMGGTQTMVERPIADAVKKKIEKTFSDRLKAAISRVLN